MPVSTAAFVRTTILLLVIGFLTAGAIVAGSVWLASRTNDSVDTLADLLRIRREAFRVVGLISDAETGQRGYLLTQEEPYLEPYTSAVARIHEEIAILRELVEGRPDLAADVELLTGAVNAKLVELQETVDLVKAGRASEALALVRTDRGKLAMESVRDISDRLIVESDSLITMRTLALRSDAASLIWVLTGGGLIILVVVGGTGLVAWRHTQDLEIARREVMALNQTLEARVRERTADVARANSEIQRFAYIVSHDLRSPLVNVMGFTSELETGLAAMRELLPEFPEGDEPKWAEARTAIQSDMPEAIGFIRSSTQKMDGLINAILRLSREGQRTINPERVDMARLLENSADIVRHRLAESGGEIRIVGPIPDIVTDRLAVEQVFGNLIDNAVKYLEPARPGEIVVSARETPMGIEFEVEDNGRGISQEDHERIFELFRRAGQQDTEGEGIGLSHVRALVRRLGGTISLRSEVGKGTTFRVRLPRTLSSMESD